MTATDIWWTRDGDRVVIVSEGGARARTLEKAEAAAWEWWADGEDLERAVLAAAACWSVDAQALLSRMAELTGELSNGAEPDGKGRW